jgi:hypothetical protein
MKKIIKILIQFEKGKLYSILEIMKLDAKYRLEEFWYSDTEMLNQLRKQKLERIKKGNNNVPFSQLQITIEEDLISIVLVLPGLYKLQVAKT